MSKYARVSTQEVNEAIEQLQYAYSHDRLSEKELDERMSKALSAHRRDEIDDLLKDIIGQEQTKSFSAILSGFDRNGPLVISKYCNIRAIIGGCSLDLRQAEFECKETIINVTAILGGVDIILPLGIKILVEGSPILGGISQQIDNHLLPPDAMRIHIKAKVILGGINIRTEDKNGAINYFRQ